MSRFIRVPSDNNDIVLVNTDYVEQVGYGPNSPFVVFIFLRGNVEDCLKARFKSSEEAIDFIKKNFILFNS